MSADSRRPEEARGHYPELFFGLVGAAGTDLQRVEQCLEEQLLTYGYQPHPISLSALIGEAYEERGHGKLPAEPEDKRIQAHMDAGDQLRREFDRGDAAALLSIRAVQRERTQSNDHSIPNAALEDGHAYIFRSLKHPDEVRTLRRVYGNAFFLISAYSPRVRRRNSLKRRIAKSHNRHDEQHFENAADNLITTDEKTPGTTLGQAVRDTFPLADAFVTETQDLENQARRVLDICFGYPYATPTQDEQGMYFADAAALRSSDLARQVGAAIVASDSDGEVLATGCNEVPRAFGGAAWEDTFGRADDNPQDHRDFQEGKDFNTTIKRDIVREVFDRLGQAGWLTEDCASRPADELVTEALNDSGNAPLVGTRLSSILEFGRAIHAEMFALMQAARRGTSVRGATLYCTAFPCHMCARHIIGAGIARVVYIQPYPKSMAEELYGDDIAVEPDRDSNTSDVVRFDPFIGISANRYRDLFSASKRKDEEGYAYDEWYPDPYLVNLGERFPSTYSELEDAHLLELAKCLNGDRSTNDDLNSESDS